MSTLPKPSTLPSHLAALKALDHINMTAAAVGHSIFFFRYPILETQETAVQSPQTDKIRNILALPTVNPACTANRDSCKDVNPLVDPLFASSPTSYYRPIRTLQRACTPTSPVTHIVCFRMLFCQWNGEGSGCCGSPGLPATTPARPHTRPHPVHSYSATVC